MWKQIIDVIASGADDQHGNPATGQALLILHALIYRQKHVESGLLCQAQQLTIRLASEANRWNGLTVMPNQAVLYPSRQAFINQHSHYLELRENQLFSLFQGLYRHTAGNGGEIVQEVIQRLPTAFEVIE